MLNKTELKALQDIESKYYMQPMLSAINADLKAEKLTLKELFNHLYEYLTNSQKAVESLIQARIARGEIKDASQARKSIAGSAFSSLIIWVFLKNKEQGNIAKHIFISSKISQIPHYKDLFFIQVGEEVQKPDVDLIIYSLTSANTLKNCLILSLKTSLRERAGQTYKWKLLMEIASADSSIKEKYAISYNPPFLPLVCFATVNFYDEINSPQHRGMFKFFDCAFIGKDIQTGEFIKPLSYLLDFISEKL